LLISTDSVPIRRALISVTDKSGITELAQWLHKEFGIEIISTGGTAKLLAGAGIPVKDVASVTGFPEMMDGRVKTLHPVIHGGLLALRDEPSHISAMTSHGIMPIDLLIVNLYAFEKTIADPATTLEHAVENIDIGGPAMIRSASKNYRSVAVVTDPIQYPKLMDHLRHESGSTRLKFRMDLAMWAFSRTASYDAAIHQYLAGRYFAEESGPTSAGLFPTVIRSYRKLDDLRYGENPHQAAALYTDSGETNGVANARQLHGKKLSYINLLDADAAYSLITEFDQPAAAVIKHANPCGCAVGENLATAFELAYAGDPVAAFGGIVALNRPVDAAAASAIVAGKKFLEVLIAPEFQPDALELLRHRWADCRLLAVPESSVQRSSRRKLKFASISGGALVQQDDVEPPTQFATVTTSQPSPSALADLHIAWRICKHVKSNAIVLVKDRQLLGVGAGQMSRVTSARLAVELARQNGHDGKLTGAVAASDAFFPFADGPQLLLDAGIIALIQPGGSKRDADTINLCNQWGIAMVFTGVRHFLH
jgi:phosphoribosylaminoimidazolecarboxamide formyltransferase/IMP cyclohydrolase